MFFVLWTGFRKHNHGFVGLGQEATVASTVPTRRSAPAISLDRFPLRGAIPMDLGSAGECRESQSSRLQC